jgi:hypothetical protein
VQGIVLAAYTHPFPSTLQVTTLVLPAVQLVPVTGHAESTAHWHDELPALPTHAS